MLNRCARQWLNRHRNWDPADTCWFQLPWKTVLYTRVEPRSFNSEALEASNNLPLIVKDIKDNNANVIKCALFGLLPKPCNYISEKHIMQMHVFTNRNYAWKGRLSTKRSKVWWFYKNCRRTWKMARYIQLKVSLHLLKELEIQN